MHGRSARSRHLGIVCLLALPFAPFGLSGQDLPTTPTESTATAGPPTFFDAVAVDVVHLDVVVTDRDDRPVYGLPRDAFRLFEDGEPVEVTHFAAVGPPRENAGTATVEQSPVEQSAGTSTSSSSEQNAGTSDTDLGRRGLLLAVFLDELHVRPLTRSRLLDTLRDHVTSTLPSGTRVALLAFDGQLTVRLPPTRDVAEITAAIETIGTASAPAAAADAERRRLLSQLGTLVDDHGGGVGGGSRIRAAAQAALSDIERFAGSRGIDLRRSLDGLEHAVGLLSGVPGRKALLYLGKPSLDPAVDLMRAWRTLADDQGIRFSGGVPNTRDLAGATRLEDVTARANAARVTIYTLDDHDTDWASSERRGSLLDARQAGSPEAATLTAGRRLDVLVGLADPTGGAMGAASLDRLLGRIEDDHRAAYTLAYTRSRTAGTRPRTLRVDVAGDGFRVRYRRSQQSRADEARMHDGTRATLLLGTGENPLEVGLDAHRRSEGEHERADDGLVPVRLTVKLPMSRLTLVPRAQVHEGALSIYVAAVDDRGAVSPVLGKPLPVRIPNETLLQALARVGTFDLDLRLRPGAHTIAVGVRDQLGHVSSFASLALPADVLAPPVNPLSGSTLP